MTNNMVMVRTLIKPRVMAPQPKGKRVPIDEETYAALMHSSIKATQQAYQRAGRPSTPGGLPKTISDKTQQQIDQERRFQEQVDEMGKHVRNNSGQTVAQMMAALGWTENRVRDIIRRALTEYPQIKSKLTRRNNTRVTVYNWEGE